ncbi:sigma-70 family RNA polymerase sigma factor [Thalassococcus sp. BH17M4-6]|uniref:sigma-70 family RNA polymerase sigma factor n=1 Tax=Thalassococcus sp. BH17M4-6 TaxID=3413148 RepID=UPI003BC670F2
MDTRSLLDALPLLRARARRLAASRAEAEDLLQTALLGLLEQDSRGRTIDKPLRYVMTSLRHARTANARQARREAPLDDAPEPQIGDASEACLCAEVLRAIDTLPPVDGLLLRMVAAGETSPAALARHLKLPKGTVMSRLSRARARLREVVGEVRE